MSEIHAVIMDIGGLVIHGDRPIPPGVTRREDVGRFPYQPSLILESIADLEV
jgi:hypothetical protein